MTFTGSTQTCQGYYEGTSLFLKWSAGGSETWNMWANNSYTSSHYYSYNATQTVPQINN
jgi:hypothetical protein